MSDQKNVVMPKTWKVVWGVQKLKPIEGLPEGAKVRIRLRGGSPGKVFTRTASKTEHFILIDNGNSWGLMKQGENVRGNLNAAIQKP